MKNLITAVPCMVILLALLLELVQIQNVCAQAAAAENAVEVFRQEVRTAGRAEEPAKEQLVRELKKITGCRAKEIRIEGGSSLVERPGQIRIRVSFPVDPVIAASSFWMIRPSRNRIRYTAERICVSEYLPPRDEKQEAGSGKQTDKDPEKRPEKGKRS